MVGPDQHRPLSPSVFPYTHSLLHEFPPTVAADLLRKAKPVVLARGKVLFRRGDPGDSCFLVRRGLVKVSITSLRGGESILTLHGEGAIIGELALIDGLPRQVTAEAVSDTLLAAISRDAFMTCLETHPEMRSALVIILAGRLRRAGEEIAWASLLSARARVARAVLRIAEVAGTDAGNDHVAIAIAMSGYDIAAMAGVSREEASRTLSAWRKAGTIGGGSGSPMVVHVAALQAEASDETGE